jgi:hypothetical protein
MKQSLDFALVALGKSATNNGAAIGKLADSVAKSITTVERGFAAIAEDIANLRGELHDMHTDLRAEIILKSDGLHKVLDFHREEQRILEARITRLERHVGVESERTITA